VEGSEEDGRRRLLARIANDSAQGNCPFPLSRSGSVEHACTRPFASGVWSDLWQWRAKGCESLAHGAPLSGGCPRWFVCAS
jgi:hypothetical protein